MQRNRSFIMLQETETLDLKLVKLKPEKRKWISRSWNRKNSSLVFVFPVSCSSFPISCSSSFDSCSWFRLVFDLFLLLFVCFTRKWSRYNYNIMIILNRLWYLRFTLPIELLVHVTNLNYFVLFCTKFTCLNFT
jgi:hypothetical protein